MASKCKYLHNGLCKFTSDGEVSEACIMGPCGKETISPAIARRVYMVGFREGHVTGVLSALNNKTGLAEQKLQKIREYCHARGNEAVDERVYATGKRHGWNIATSEILKILEVER